MKTILFLLITITGVCVLQAQTTPSFDFTFDHMAVSVKDVNRSAEFYKTVLNLQEITNRSKLEGVRWFAIGEGKELHLISILKTDVTVNKAMHLALKTAHFDALVKMLEARKIPYSDWPGTPNTFNVRADGIKQVFFQDLDGYWIEVNSLETK